MFFDRTAIPVVFSIVLDVLYLVVPIFPVVLLYRLFPKGNSATVEGRIMNLTLRAGGAFAAYVITVLLGFRLTEETSKLISAMVDAPWEITGGS